MRSRHLGRSGGRRSGVCLALIGLLAACDIEFQAQTIRLHHEAATDSLEIGLLYEGLVLGDANKRTQAGDAAERILAGRREFMFGRWPLYFDLEDQEKSLRKELDGLLEEEPSGPVRARARLLQRWLAALGRIEVEQVGIFRDEQDRLGGYQKIRIRDLQAFVELTNDSISDWVQREVADPQATPELDARTRPLLLAHAIARRPWLWFEGDQLNFEVPLSREAFSRMIRECGQGLASIDANDVPFVRLFGHLLASARQLRFDHEVLGGSLRSSDSACIEFELLFESLPYADTLRAELESRGHVPAARTRDEVLQQIR